MNTIAREHAVAAALIPMTDVDGLKAAGIRYPETLDGWRWLYRVREQRGFEKAFRRVGRRVLVDVPAYFEAVRHSDQGETSTQSAPATSGKKQ